MINNKLKPKKNYIISQNLSMINMSSQYEKWIILFFINRYKSFQISVILELDSNGDQVKVARQYNCGHGELKPFLGLLGCRQ